MITYKIDNSGEEAPIIYRIVKKNNLEKNPEPKPSDDPQFEYSRILFSLPRFGSSPEEALKNYGDELPTENYRLYVEKALTGILSESNVIEGERLLFLLDRRPPADCIDMMLFAGIRYYMANKKITGGDFHDALSTKRAYSIGSDNQIIKAEQELPMAKIQKDHSIKIVEPEDQTDFDLDEFHSHKTQLLIRNDGSSLLIPVASARHVNTRGRGKRDFILYGAMEQSILIPDYNSKSGKIGDDGQARFFALVPTNTNSLHLGEKDRLNLMDYMMARSKFLQLGIASNLQLKYSLVNETTTQSRYQTYTEKDEFQLAPGQIDRRTGVFFFK